MALKEIRRHLRYLAGLPVRSDEVGNLLDLFIVFAVATILVVRILLYLTGYPQIGGGVFHIAHMLWGGLLMMVALILMQSIITRWARRMGAVLGGIGFGLFIDELGKFITKDNDYFFAPTYSIIYVLFVLLYFMTRNLLRTHGLSAQESLANAIEYLKLGTQKGFEEGDKRKAQELIKHADSGHPFTHPIRHLLEETPILPHRNPFLWERMARWGRRVYQRAISSRAFPKIISIIFLSAAVLGLYELRRRFTHLFAGDPLHISDWGALVSGTVATVLVLMGDFQLLRRKFLSAYHYFDRALLVYLLVGQVFAFVRIQLKGVISLFIVLLLLAGVRYMMAQEERRVRMEKLA